MSIRRRLGVEPQVVVQVLPERFRSCAFEPDHYTLGQPTIYRDDQDEARVCRQYPSRLESVQPAKRHRYGYSEMLYLDNDRVRT